MDTQVGSKVQEIFDRVNHCTLRLEKFARGMLATPKPETAENRIKALARSLRKSSRLKHLQKTPQPSETREELS